MRNRIWLVDLAAAHATEVISGRKLQKVKCWQQANSAMNLKAVVEITSNKRPQAENQALRNKYLESCMSSHWKNFVQFNGEWQS